MIYNADNLVSKIIIFVKVYKIHVIMHNIIMVMCSKCFVLEHVLSMELLTV